MKKSELRSHKSLMSQPEPGWPDPLDEEAYHGLVGEIVRKLEPHTEADPSAILLQFLVAFGNVVGRHAYYQVEADDHYTNLFALIVGESSKARKGTSWSHVKRSYKSIDPPWVIGRIKAGLSSGEGLIWAVRDDEEEDDE